MITKEQLMEGILLYIKKEVIPILPDSAKVMAGAVLLRNMGRITEMVSKLTAGGLARTIGIVEDTGMIDVDIWAQNLKESIKEFGGGKLTIQLPLLAPIKLSGADIDTMRRYAKGELT